MTRSDQAAIFPLRVDQAWTVLRGFALVHGAWTVVVPSGGTWPGPGLERVVADALCPADACALPGCEVSAHVTPQALEAGRALILAQILTRGDAQERFKGFCQVKCLVTHVTLFL